MTNRALGLTAAVRLRDDFKDSDLLDLNVALAKAHVQQGHTNEAVTSFAEALRLAADRAAKAKIVAEAAAREGVLEKLAETSGGRCTVPGRAGTTLCRAMAIQRWLGNSGDRTLNRLDKWKISRKIAIRLSCNRLPPELVVYGNFWLRLIVGERLAQIASPPGHADA